MVIIGAWQGHSVHISLKSNCLTLSFEAEGQAEVYSYDFCGRLWTALVSGISYRRGLDGKVVAKWGSGWEARERRWLEPQETWSLQEHARSRAANLLAAIQAGAAQLDQPLSSQGRLAFEHILSFGSEAYQADVDRYHQVYRPVGILPPDQYMAVVLQATEGCAFNSCTFCTFYKDRPFRIKKLDEFHAHAEAVRDFIGEGISLRRTLFLGDANALVIPMRRLLPLVEVAHQVFDVDALGGIYAFLDGFSGEKKSPQDYTSLARLGFQRIYIGLESGNPELLRFLRKPGNPQSAVRAVRAMKTGGIPVGVIVLLGAGGQTYHKQHVRDTIRVLNEMQLDMHDLIYFSELITEEGTPYTRDAYAAHLQPISSEERIAQGEAIERGLRFSRRGGTPHISRYDIREFVY